MAKTVVKKSVWLLPVILLSYFVVGFPDGAFTISWLGIYEDFSLSVVHSGYILVGYSVTYTLAGVLLSRFNRFMRLQTIYFWGLIIMGAGFVWLALSQNFFSVLGGITLYGFGTGAMASSMNSYMAKHFTARHNNWMHCFWGGGASVTPLIMSQMMALLSWRAGYFVITGILGVVAIILLMSMYKKIWINEEENISQEDPNKADEARPYLEKKWHQAVEIFTFFFLGGTDYTLVFFTGMVLIDRGLSYEMAGFFSAVYYISMTAGRMFFGWSAKRLREVPIIRIGIAIAIAGIGVLYFTGNIVGMALTGFGLAPLLPTLVSDTSNRFSPRILSKLVGYELAAFGAGIAVLFFATSLVLEYITLEALFPIGIGFIVLVALCNEVLERARKRLKD
ncbi:MAG: MFS transporter [Defluviitaleaceae bacterium]|nr:MFS transporter [Defluviitaleaceae bacterium]MCL2273727.1 MFS transporter [Defluviitaleaceae bacterium]